ncbi:MAG: GTP cyclohydrolase I FolE [Chitinophagaceae bacterium]|nr:GTP cyclohydrolase I FolE [Chitinophagaceae bacterium]
MIRDESKERKPNGVAFGLNHLSVLRNLQDGGGQPGAGHAALQLSRDEKIEQISRHFRGIMETLGLDLSDDSLRDTPGRVAKMYVDEVFQGLDPERKPAITLFQNRFQYDQMLVEKDITLYSYCEHHFVPIIGKAHVGYISSGKVIGLSKLNRIVQYYARRPQVQERLTVEIGQALQEILDTEDVAVMMEATHLCVASRGVQDIQSSTITAFLEGRFRQPETKRDFLSFIH